MNLTPLPKAVKQVWANQVTRLPCLGVKVKFQFPWHHKKSRFHKAYFFILYKLGRRNTVSSNGCSSVTFLVNPCSDLVATSTRLYCPKLQITTKGVRHQPWVFSRIPKVTSAFHRRLYQLIQDGVRNRTFCRVIFVACAHNGLIILLKSRRKWSSSSFRNT